MISDVLSDAVSQIDCYLENPSFDGCYEGEIRQELLTLREAMDAMRAKLDTPPTAAEIEVMPAN